MPAFMDFRQCKFVFFVLFVVKKKHVQELNWLFKNINLYLPWCNCTENLRIILAVGSVARTHKSLIYNI